MGRCPNCGEWNSLTEQPSFVEASEGKEETKKLNLTPLSKIKPLTKERKITGLYEFDRVLGNGFIPGEVILLTGEPGVGKSTLLLQSLQKIKTVYISGEESAEQVKERAQRLKISLANFLFSDDLQIEGIIAGIENLKDKPEIVVVDSIQTIYSKNLDSASGSINQLKETTKQLIIFAKKNKIPIIIIGHVTKEGEIAGPKTLEHMVDCVLSFEGEKVSNYRVLRAEKNRFGATDEIGIFEMIDRGLIEVNNPLVFLDKEKDIVAGKAIVGIAEGKRSLFYEIQSLAVPTNLAVPRRVVKGVDYNKVLLLLAVIRKQLGLPLDNFDIYVNVVGGISIKSTAADLGVMASLISSIKNQPISLKTVFVGEVGLLGEVRKVFFEDKIIREAKRLKFKKIFSSQNCPNIKQLKLYFDNSGLQP
jgi:DNA repair protein RadA/Sms